MSETKFNEVFFYLPRNVFQKEHILNNWHKFSVISFGINNTNGFEKIFNAVDIALETGYRSFVTSDCSSIPTQEEDFGLVLEELLPKYDLKRQDIFITSKVFPKKFGVETTTEAFQRSCENLKTNYIDTYLMQWPGGDNVDSENQENAVIREETWKELVKLNMTGLVNNIGVCNFEIKHLEHLMRVSSITPAVNQVEFHPKYPQLGLLDFCKENNILLQTIAFKETFHPLLLKNETIKKVARTVNRSPTQVILKWCLNKGVAVISESEYYRRIQKNFQLFDFILEKPEMCALNSIEGREKYLRNPVCVI